MVGLAVVRRLDLTSPLHGNFLALLERLDEMHTHSLIFSKHPHEGQPFRPCLHGRFRALLCEISASQ